MKKFDLKKISMAALSAIMMVSSFMLMSCYSVFDGGVGGTVKDSSTDSGIADLEVYAYTDASVRDADYNAYTDSTKDFSPQTTSYYAHTTTGSDGTFQISKLLWQSWWSDFGKDDDYTTVYLLYYNEKYGLQKGRETLIVSDSYSDTVSDSLTAVKKEVTLSLNFKDVADDSSATEPLSVTVWAPQTFDAESKPLTWNKYTSTMTGSGTQTVLYPIGTDAENIYIMYQDNASDVVWKACYNGDSADSDYSFRTFDADDTDTWTSTAVASTVADGSTVSINLYGKKRIVDVPTVSGKYLVYDTQDTNGNDTGYGTADDDGKSITLYLTSVDGTDCTAAEKGTTTTASSTVGTSSQETHGQYSGLGNGTITLDDYTGQYATLGFKVSDDESTPHYATFTYKTSQGSTVTAPTITATSN